MFLKLVLIAVLGLLAYSQFKKSPMSFTNLVVGAVSTIVVIFLVLGLFGHVVFVFSISLLLLLAIVLGVFLFARSKSSTQKT